jgi:hypothetical protein
MTTIQEGRQTFTFPSTWAIVKYDESDHYRTSVEPWKHGLVLSGTATVVANCGVDFVGDDGTNLWLVEVKDYRIGATTVPVDLPDVVRRKVRDTLAGLALAAAHPPSDVHAFGRALGRTPGLIVALDICAPPGYHPSALLSLIANLTTRLGAKLPKGMTIRCVTRATPSPPWTAV